MLCFTLYKNPDDVGFFIPFYSFEGEQLQPGKLGGLLCRTKFDILIVL